MAAKALAATDTPVEMKDAGTKTKGGQAAAPVDIVTRADALNLAGQAALTAGDLGAAEERFRQALDLDRQSENTVGRT